MANNSPYPATPTGSAQHVFAITPADPGSPSTTQFFAKALLCSVDMTLKIRDAAGNDVVSVPFQKGYNPIAVQEVWSTGSTLNGGAIFGLGG